MKRNPKHLVLFVLVVTMAACSRPEPTPPPIRAVKAMVLKPEATSISSEFAAEVKA